MPESKDATQSAPCTPEYTGRLVVTAYISTYLEVSKDCIMARISFDIDDHTIGSLSLITTAVSLGL
jgi:hypothetical protein